MTKFTKAAGLSACWALSACSPSLPRSEEEIQLVLGRMRASYDACPMYRDDGRVVDRGGGTGEYVHFRTRYSNDGEFEFSFGNADEPASLWKRVAGTGKKAAFDLAVARGVSGGASTRVPGILLRGELAPYSVPHWRSNRFVSNATQGPYAVLLSEAMVGGYREESWFFIDRQSYMIKGVVARYFAGETLELDFATSYWVHPNSCSEPGR